MPRDGDRNRGPRDPRFRLDVSIAMQLEFCTAQGLRASAGAAMLSSRSAVTVSRDLGSEPMSRGPCRAVSLLANASPMMTFGEVFRLPTNERTTLAAWPARALRVCFGCAKCFTWNNLARKRYNGLRSWPDTEGPLGPALSHQRRYPRLARPALARLARPLRQPLAADGAALEQHHRRQCGDASAHRLEEVGELTVRETRYERTRHVTLRRPRQSKSPTRAPSRSRRRAGSGRRAPSLRPSCCRQ